MQSLERGIQCLLSLAKSQEPLTVEEISGKTGIPVSSVYRLLRPFEKLNLIQRNEQGKRLLGLAILELFSSAHNIYGFDIADIALPFMKKIASVTEETVLLTTIVGYDVVCIEAVASPHPICLSPQKGKVQSACLGCTSKILLAYTSLEFQMEVLRRYEGYVRGDGKVVTVDLLMSEMDQIRKDGYAITFGEVDKGAAGISTPIFDRQNKIKAGISIVGPESRFDIGQINSHKVMLIEAAKEITRRYCLSGLFLSEDEETHREAAVYAGGLTQS